jgi:hypothetical protein
MMAGALISRIAYLGECSPTGSARMKPAGERAIWAPDSVV